MVYSTKASISKFLGRIKIVCGFFKHTVGEDGTPKKTVPPSRPRADEERSEDVFLERKYRR